MAIKGAMKKYSLLTSILILACGVMLWPAAIEAREIPAIVSVDWVEKNLGNPNLIVLDIRKVEDYHAGHIPGAVNAYYGTWAYGRDAKRMEIPYEDDLFDAMGGVGILPGSWVVVTCHTSHCYFTILAARVVCTLLCAGLENVAILDGGHDEWVRAGKPVSRDIVKPRKTTYQGKFSKDILADKDYVVSRLGKALFVDTRDRAIFTGEKKQAFVEKAGRIPGAVNLPASEAYTGTGTFKTKEKLEAVAAGIVGTDRSREIITYCDAGRHCPTWAFILKEVLGYRNVKLYDGSFEEWSKDPNLPVTK